MRRRGLRKSWLSDEEIAAATPNELIEAFSPLAESYARKRFPYSPDAVQDAYLGLTVAAHRYDPEKGAFHTYAHLWMRQKVNRGAAARNRMISLPESQWSNMRLIALTVEELEQELEETTDEAVAERSGLDIERVRFLRSVPVARHANEGEQWNAFDSETEFRQVEDWDAVESYITDDKLREEARAWVSGESKKRLSTIAKKIQKDRGRSG